MIGGSGKRGSGISVLATRHDDEDMFIHCLHYVIRMSIDEIKENRFTLKREKAVDISKEL